MATATTTTTTPTTDPPIHALVIDAGPLIANTSASSLLSRAQRIYTTPAVVAEIRDAATRSRLETTWLPFLAQRTPRAESVRVVAEFARRTGDFAALSVTDVQLLALTYELECEGNGGDWRLRRVPGQRGVNGPVPGRGEKGKEEEEKEEKGEGVREKKQEEEGGGAATAESKEAETAKPKRKSKRARMAAKKRAERQEAGEGSEKTGETGETETEAQPPLQPEQAVPAEGKKRNKRKGRKAAPAQDGAAAGELTGAEAAEAGEEEEAEGEAAAEPGAEAAEKPAPKPAAAAAAEAASQEAPAEAPAATTLPTPPSTDDSASDSDSDSDSGWITATNLHSYRHSAAHTPVASAATTKKQWPLAAALATTDYAMQNVLLQMNLHLVSPHGLHRIRAIRTWVLRCHACFKLCRDMARQFCPTCGGATLLKTSCSTDSSGAFTLHLKRNMQWNNRGAVYSIPKTQHGSASGKGVRRNLVLREDQIEYQREVRVRARQKERDLLDPDYLPGILTGERREAGGAVPKIGYGRRNPNERQGGRNKH